MEQENNHEVIIFGIIFLIIFLIVIKIYYLKFWIDRVNKSIQYTENINKEV